MNKKIFDAENNICKSCRLCCDGTLYSHVILEANESEVKFSELDLIKVEGTFQFNQPCKALDSHSGCKVYANRPSICRNYTCKLLSEFKKGLLTQKEALAAILKVQQLKNNLKEEMISAGFPESCLKTPRTQLDYIKFELSSKENIKKFSNIYLQYGTLVFLLKKHFEKSNQK